MSLEKTINQAFENRAEISPTSVSAEIREAINESLNLLDSGQRRVAEKVDGQWVVNQWLKKAVLLSFRINDNRVMDGGETRYFDKVEPKFGSFSPEDFRRTGARVVPPAAVRKGAYIAPNVVLMPSFFLLGLGRNIVGFFRVEPARRRRSRINHAAVR